MDWSPPVIWWILAGIFLIFESLTLSFYLLMVAVGLAAGAICGHLGFSVASQITAAAVVAGACLGALHQFKSALPRQKSADLLDAGQEVMVEQWDAGRHARVFYRGTFWDARIAGEPDQEPSPGKHRIREIEGSVLLLDRSA